jgi:hypothetical protein
MKALFKQHTILPVFAFVVLATCSTQAFAQSFAFSGSEAVALSRYYDGRLPVPQSRLVDTFRKCSCRYPAPQSQTAWPSAAAMGNQR